MIVLKLTGGVLVAGIALLFVMVLVAVMLEIKVEDIVRQMAAARNR